MGENTAETAGIAEAAPPQERSYTLQTLQWVVGPGWQVVSANRAAAQWMDPQAAVAGQCLRRLLLAIEPRWAGLLPEAAADLAAQGVFLPWSSESQPGLGWQVEALGGAGAERVFLSFVPGLAPELSAAATEDGLSGAVGPALHNLFFRTQQVEARFRQFMRLLPGVPFTQDAQRKFSFLSEPLKLLVGEGNFVRLAGGEDWQNWIHAEDVAQYRRNLETAERTHAPVSTRFRLQVPEGEHVLYLLELRIPVRSIRGELTGYEGLWLDLTRQTVAEKRLQQAAWKESLAEISGSLSHDFNNILTGIVNLADLMSSGDPHAEGRAEDLAIIRDSARQAQELIQRIVSLNREKSGEIQLHNLVEIVQKQRELIRIILPRNVQFEMYLPQGELPVQIDAVAVRRVLLNFATNARDALGYRGRVEVTLREVDLADYPREHLLSHRCAVSGQAAELIFKDNGSGIDPKIIHRIFGAYFSTKQTARGSGLGLYSITQFAQENGFDFGVRSKLNEGTEMILLIPLDTFEFEDDWQDDAAAVPAVGRIHVIGATEQSERELEQAARGLGLVLNFVAVEDEAAGWSKAVAAGDVVAVFMDHRKNLPEGLKAALAARAGTCKRVLFHRGFNPDEINHLRTHLFEQIVEEHLHAEENLRALLNPAVASEETESASEPKGMA